MSVCGINTERVREWNSIGSHTHSELECVLHVHTTVDTKYINFKLTNLYIRYKDSL